MPTNYSTVTPVTLPITSTKDQMSPNLNVWEQSIAYLWYKQQCDKHFLRVYRDLESLP